MNLELQQRRDELDVTNMFLHSILGNLQVGVVVVDKDIGVKAWNHQAEDLCGLRSQEVIGQHFMNLDIGLPVHDLLTPIRACLAGEKPRQELILEATNRRGKRILCRVACTPLKGAERQSQGAILLMEEVEA